MVFKCKSLHSIYIKDGRHVHVHLAIGLHSAIEGPEVGERGSAMLMLLQLTTLALTLGGKRQHYHRHHHHHRQRQQDKMKCFDFSLLVLAVLDILVQVFQARVIVIMVPLWNKTRVMMSSHLSLILTITFLDRSVDTCVP
jgi:hypothetical protein